MGISRGKSGTRAGSTRRASALSTQSPHRSRSGRKIEAAGRRPRAILALILGIAACAFLASCAPGQPTAHAPTATAQPTATVPVTPSATAIPRLVYQADWSHGMAGSGWTATSGWTVSGGVLHSDTGSDRDLISPFRPATADYAVEFQAQIISIAPGPTQYALSADPSADGASDGYVALFDHVTPYYSTFANHPQVMIYIDPMSDQDMYTFQPHDYELGTRLRTYRVEVRGPEATLLIDGRISSWARSTKTARLAAGPLRFSCTGVELRLSNFKVYAL